MIKLMKKRDFKENELHTRKMALSSMDIMKQSSTDDFDRQLAAYQKWKLLNKIEGIKY